MAALGLAMGGAYAQDTSDQAQPAPERFGGNRGAVFELGEIVVHGGDDRVAIGGQSVSQSVVSADEVRTENRNTLDDALRTTPGVSVSNSGGSRNEKLVYVRGFDRFQVPLYIDGVRVYLPADNRIDFGRFLTPDLSEIQVQKGYVSVLSGPGGMGGAINLVTRKPIKELEAELRTGIDLGNTGELAAFTTYGSVGMRQDKFYLQASGTFRDSNGWFLPRGYNPVRIGAGAPVENGGRRDFTQVQDWRVNVKAGFTPNATDEYVISYTHQQGTKGAPYSVAEPVRGITPTPLPAGTAYQRDWTWPYWNISSVAFNSHTAIGEKSYVKSKIYYNTFDNLLSAFDDSTFSTQTQSRAFDSYYKDYAFGFSLEGGTDLIPMNSLKAAIHYRRDSHSERQHNRPGVSAFVEPWHEKLEDTWSFAVENTFHATDQVDLIGGVSYDLNDLKKAQEYDTRLFSYPLGGASAFNWQAAVIWTPDPDHELHASVSSRTRFSNLFERYSTRFGAALPNPSLSPERANNYELGWTGTITETLRGGASVFYSDVQDVIQSISIGRGLIQNQNVGNGKYYGTELFAEWDVLPALTIGGRYTYLKRQITDPVRPGIRPVGTPEHLAYIFADWHVTDKFTVSPNVELSSARWSTDRLEENFFLTAGFALVNLNMEYNFNDTISANFGVRNVFDANYELAEGFPEAGRTFYLSTRLVF